MTHALPVEPSSGRFFLPKSSFRVVRLSSKRTLKDNDDETLIQQSARVLKKAYGVSSVIVDNQPLEAVGNVSLTNEEAAEFEQDLRPYVEASIQEWRQRQNAASTPTYR